MSHKQNGSWDARATSQFSISFSTSAPAFRLDERSQSGVRSVHGFKAMNNLVVLAREPTGASLLFKSGAVDKILAVIAVGVSQHERSTKAAYDQQVEYILAAQRALDELAKDEARVGFWLYSAGQI